MRHATVLSSVVAALIGTPLIVLSLHVAYAQVMSSTHYSIEADSINTGGGNSSSTNYQSESTVGEVATGQSTSTSYMLRAGYQQMLETYIALASTGAVTMSPSIPGVTGGTANGSSTFTVITDSYSGYTLTIKASASPAMRHGADTISDYVASTTVPDFTFTTAAGDAHFGYSPKGADVVQHFLDNGSTCGTGALQTADACWDGLSTTATEIAAGTGSNVPNGATTTVNFRVGIGSAVVQPPGTYYATTTVTALSL